jgi:hypothetical protein
MGTHSSVAYPQNIRERETSFYHQEKNPRLLTQLRNALRSRHYSRRTEETYCLWVKRYCHFHKLRHPAQMSEPEINSFLTKNFWGSGGSDPTLVNVYFETI